MIIVALGLQFWVLGKTIISGLLWSGWGMDVAFAQAVVGLVLVVWVGRRRPALALVVPLVSGLITFGLYAPFIRDYMSSEGHGGEVMDPDCTADANWAVLELVPPDGVITQLQGDDRGYGCVARVTTSLTGSDWRAHYEREFADHGWETTAVGRPAATAVRNQFSVTVEYHAEDSTIWIDVDPR